MLRTAVRLTPTFVIPIFERQDDYDKNWLNTQNSGNPQTGMDRVKKMFTKNEFNEPSVELHSVVQTTLFGAFTGACFGGFIKSRDAYIYFLENNQATIFKTTLQAKKKLQDFVTVAFAKGAVYWGWRVGIFTGMFSFVSTVISVYRDESSLAEYIFAGAVTGAVYKANLGLTASLVGAGLGGTLSGLAGVAIMAILKVSGVSMEDIRKALYTIKLAREDQLKQAEEKAAEIKHDSLTRHHDRFVEERGVKTIEEIPVK